MAATPLSNHTRPVSPLKYVFLTEWWLDKASLQRPGLCVAGITYGERERLFMSAAIAQRYEANLLETEDGIIVQFRGFINSSRSSQNGFSSQVCEDFLLGFPDNWKEYSTHSFKDEDVAKCDNTTKNDNTKCSNAMNTMERKSEDNNNIPKLSQPIADLMDNGKSGVSDVAGVSQVGNPNTRLSSENMFESPISAMKIRKDRFSSDFKEKQDIQSKVVDETKSTSRSRKSLKTAEKVRTVTSVRVRRSPRLHKC